MIVFKDNSEMSKIGKSRDFSANALSIEEGEGFLGEIKDEFSVKLDHCICDQSDFLCILDAEDYSLSGFKQMGKTSTLVLYFFD